MTLEFEWIVKFISPEIEVGKDDKKTSKIVICLEETWEMEFPNKIAVDFIGKKIQLLDGLFIKEWDVIKVNYNIFYNRFDKADGTLSIFNSIRGWRIEKVSEGNKEDLPF